LTFIAVVIALAILVLEYRLLILSYCKFLKIKHSSPQAADYRSKKTECKADPVPTDFPTIYILLPCHKEHDLIESTINYYSEIAKECKNINVFFITGNEYHNNKLIERDSNKAIRSILETKHHNKITLLHDTSPESTKSSKLLFATEHIAKDKKTYIGIFDFDARPQRGSFAWLEADVMHKENNGLEFPTVYQYVSINLNGLANSSWFIKNHSIVNLRRSLGIEGRNGNIKYCVGSGMFLNYNDFDSRFLLKYNDDIVLGYHFRILGKKQVVVPFINVTSVTTSFKSCIKQHMKIFYGLFQFWNCLNHHDSIKLTAKIKMSIDILWSIFSEWIEFIGLLICVGFLSQNLVILVMFLSLYSAIWNFYSYLQKKCAAHISLPYKKNAMFILVTFLLSGFVYFFFRWWSLTCYLFKQKKMTHLFQESTEKAK